MNETKPVALFEIGDRLAWGQGSLGEGGLVTRVVDIEGERGYVIDTKQRTPLTIRESRLVALKAKALCWRCDRGPCTHVDPKVSEADILAHYSRRAR